MKIKLHLRIILLVNYIMEGNLFVYVDCFPVASYGFLSEKMSQKKEKKKE